MVVHAIEKYSALNIIYRLVDVNNKYDIYYKIVFTYYNQRRPRGVA